MFLGIFILSLILLAFSYKNILTIGFEPENFTFKISIICAIFCTLLFFFSLSGFILYLVRKSKKIYFKDLNIFILNQLNNKVRTNFLSMSLICIMLFITLVVLSLGISFKNSFENQLEKLTPFDASIVLRTNDTNYDIKDFLNKIDFKKDENELYASYYKYTSKIKISDLFNPNKNESADKYFVDFIKLSDYNKMLELQGKNNIVLNDNEVIIFSNRIDLAKSINQYLNDSNKISIQNKEYLVNNKKALETNLETYPVINLNCTIIINDDFIPSHDIYESVLNVKYLDNNREEKNEKYSKINNDYIHGQYKEFNSNKISAYLKDNIYSKSKGAATTILFIGIYLGIIFLIASMAILALQQLSEASDSIERYKSLKKIGASNKMINKTIFTQILIYFSLPLILALVHSCIGIIVSNDYIRKFNQADVSFSIWFTVASFFIVYIGYFFITYIGYKNIVKNNI